MLFLQEPSSKAKSEKSPDAILLSLWSTKRLVDWILREKASQTKRTRCFEHASSWIADKRLLRSTWSRRRRCRVRLWEQANHGKSFSLPLKSPSYHSHVTFDRATCNLRTLIPLSRPAFFFGGMSQAGLKFEIYKRPVLFSILRLFLLRLILHYTIHTSTPLHIQPHIHTH